MSAQASTTTEAFGQLVLDALEELNDTAKDTLHVLQAELESVEETCKKEKWEETNIRLQEKVQCLAEDFVDNDEIEDDPCDVCKAKFSRKCEKCNAVTYEICRECRLDRSCSMGVDCHDKRYDSDDEDDEDGDDAVSDRIKDLQSEWKSLKKEVKNKKDLVHQNEKLRHRCRVYDDYKPPYCSDNEMVGWRDCEERLADGEATCPSCRRQSVWTLCRDCRQCECDHFDECDESSNGDNSDDDDAPDEDSDAPSSEDSESTASDERPRKLRRKSD